MRIAVAGGTGVVGHYVVEEARRAGHEPVVLARSAGVDVRSADGLAAALDGVDVVVDATNAGTTEEEPAIEFFVESTANLTRLAAASGVRHLVVVSIVGIDEVPTGYYAAKLAHERAARAGEVPATVVRATQFHEFPAQMIGWHRTGSVAAVPDLRVRTVAARTAGRVLVEVAAGPPAGRSRDLGGPDEADLVDLARQFAARFDPGLRVVSAEAPVPPGALLPGEEARIEGPAFGDWLETGDAARLGEAR